MADAERCDVCDAELVAGTSPPAEGAFLDIAVSLESFDVLACPQGHELRYPWSGWSNEVREGAVDALPAARYEAFRGLACRACDGPLERGAAEPGELPLRIPMSRGRPVALALRLPLLTCAQCGAEQAVFTGDLASDVFTAIDDALDVAGVEP